MCSSEVCSSCAVDLIGSSCAALKYVAHVYCAADLMGSSWAAKKYEAHVKLTSWVVHGQL